jgi:hypothetical protein
MSLMQLLTVGRSLRSVKGGRSPFRPAEQGMLPKFAASRAPEVKSEVKERPQPSPARSPFVPLSHGPATPERGSILKRILSLFKRNKTMNAVEAEPQSVSGSAPAKPEQAFPFGRWTLFSNPFNRSSKTRPKTDAGPVQTELSLDAVKPVRNDLSDSDLELVPVKAHFPAAPPAATTTVTSAQESESSGVVWHQLKNHLFGAEKH